MDEPEFGNAMVIATRQARQGFGLRNLLDRLLRHVRAYPTRVGDKMPSYQLAFLIGVGGGDGADGVVRDALIEFPELWKEALPDALVIVRRDMLTRYFDLTSDDIAAFERVAQVELDRAARQRFDERREARRGLEVGRT